MTEGPPHDPWRAELPERTPSPSPPDDGEQPAAVPPADQRHTEELPTRRPRSHRGRPQSPLLQRLLPATTAVVVVVVVIVLLIVINGKSPGTGPGAGVVTGPTVVHGLPTPTPDASTSATTGAVVSPSVVPYSPTPVTSPRGTASHPSSRPAVATGTARAPVVVLNNSRISGLAHQVAGELAAKGWQIESVGNAQGRLAQTTLYYPTGEHAAARHLAHDFPSIQAIRSADAAGIRSHGNDLTLVVTRYWT